MRVFDLGQTRAACSDGFFDHCIFMWPSYVLLQKGKVFTSSYFWYVPLPWSKTSKRTGNQSINKDVMQIVLYCWFYVKLGVIRSVAILWACCYETRYKDPWCHALCLTSSTTYLFIAHIFSSSPALLVAHSEVHLLVHFSLCVCPFLIYFLLKCRRYMPFSLILWL